MKKNVSIIKLIFRRIAEIWRTIPIEEVGYPIENNHRSTVEKVEGNSISGFRKGGKQKHVHNTIKKINKANVMAAELRESLT